MQGFEAVSVIGADTIRRVLSYEASIPVMREAMMALSSGRTRQLLRTFIPLGEGRTLGIMPGALSLRGYYGAKLVSVFRDPDVPSRSAHRGIVALFEPDAGQPVCVADAEEITLIRTGAASAVATDALARSDAKVLTVLGCGHQAIAHAEAISRVRALSLVRIWGRSADRAATAARHLSDRIEAEIDTATNVEKALAGADIVCTVTSASEPILRGCWLEPGMHINLVGSSSSAATEADTDVVVRGSYFVDSRQSALAQAGEFLRAKSEGRVTDTHIRAEIGDVLLGSHPGRNDAREITIYKSLGHAIQDLAATSYVYEQIVAMGKS
jgi:ornithine cyclodeaminase